jgi:hypothetical protein
MPEDYVALQELLNVKKRGEDLLLFALQHLTHRKLARDLITKAQRRNYRMLNPTPAAVNASRVVAALLLKGMETVATDGRGIKSGSRARRNAKQAA